MALVLNDRVRETSTTTGTGTLDLAGAVSGFETFVTGIGDNNTTYYAIVNRSAEEWELGVGTVDDQSTDTLARTTILSSSNSDSAVDFSAGVKDVFVTLPASKSVHEDASSDVNLPNDLVLASDSSVLKFGADSDTTLTHTDGTGLTLNSTNKLTFGDAASFVQQSSNGVLRIDGEATVDINASTAVTVSNDLKLDSDSAVLAFGSDSEITLTHVADTGLALKHTATADDKPVALTLQTGETDIAANDVIGKIDFQAPDEGTGTDAILVAAGIEAVSEGDFSSSSNATKLSFKTAASEAASEKMSLSSGGNLTISGDLTVSGDDITMGTNTAGNLLIADGTNFNSVAAGSLTEISTVANDDVFLAVDTSGGGLKKITRSTIVSGLAVGGVALSNVVEDTTPQLGGNLDLNGADIVTTSNATLDLAPNGTGTVVVRGNTNSGAVVFNCESNSHGQKVYGQPHSASVTNTLMLPAGADSTLVSLVSEDTLTNKTLTTPIIAEIDSGADITLDATADIVLDAAGGNVEFKDAGTLQLTLDMDGTAGVQIIQLGVDSDDLVFNQYDGNEVMRIADDRAVYFFDKGGEKISSDGTDFTFNSGNDINLTATTDINIPSNVGLTFGNDGEKIEGDGTDLTIAGNKINLTATADVHIPNNVGIVFGGASEKIEGDGTDLVISANNLTVDAAADIILDAGGNDFNFKAGGTEVLRITNSSSDVIIKPIVDAKDLIFQQRDGTEVARIEDNGTFNVVTAKLAINGTAITSTAAELNILDGVTSTAAELNLVDGITAGTISASLAVIVDSNKDITGFRNVTLTGELDAGSLDISGNADIDGTLEADAITVDGTAIGSLFASQGDATALAIALG